MTHDIEQIRILCETYCTEPKLLLIPSGSMRTQILKTLTDHGVYPLNLNLKTARQLAYDIAATYIEKNDLTILDSRGANDVITDVARSLQEINSLCFFDKIEITPGICKAVTRTVFELLESGYAEGHVNLGKIENNSKRLDLETIIKAYSAWKKANSSIDYTDIADIALTVLEEKKPEYVSGYVLNACQFSYIEEKIISKIGIQTENRDIEADATPQPELHVQASPVRFFDAYGSYVEAKEVLRLIFQNRQPFDKVLIVSTSAEPYAQLFYQLIQQYTYNNDALHSIKEFPMTFGTGLPLTLSSPARLLMLLLDWIGSGYRSQELINIFSSDMFDVKTDQRDNEGNLPPEDNVFGKLGVINVIKRASLTWQRRSYIPCLEKHIDYLAQRDNTNTRTMKAATWLKDFIGYAYETVPEAGEDGLVDAGTLLGGLKALISRYKRIYSAFDSQGLNITLQELDTSLKGRRVSVSEAVDIIKDYMKDVRIMVESPCAGKIHFTTYKNAAWIERDNVYLIGLGADYFPGMALEDPLLLDVERMSPPMLTSADRTSRNIRIMNAFIEGVTGSLTCSYSCYDTVEIRDCYPAALFHKIKEQHPNEDVRHVDFVIEDANRFIDDNDYWMHKALRGKAFGIQHGAAAEAAGSESVLFEAMWQPEDAESKPDIELSATSLTTYMECKYKYFLKHILNLKEVREGGFDALGWMSAIEAGNVYHKIFEDFSLYSMENPGILQNREDAIAHIRSIAENEISSFEELLPVAGDFHMNRQRSEIYDNTSKFIDYEIAQVSQRETLFAEYVFGEESPVLLDVGGGMKIKVTGKIDRIDKLSDGSIEVIDYKTGSSYKYQELKSPDDSGIDEANAQLVFYYLALCELVRSGDAPSELAGIKNMSYRFITAKGNYDIISMVVTDDAEAVYKEALRKICEEIDNGVFPPEKGMVNAGDDNADLEPECRYCGFNTTCRYITEGDE